MNWSGVWVATVTPFGANGTVDLAAYEDHLKWLASCGVQGFVPCGTTGEGSVLAAEEWREVITRTVAIARASGLRTIAGCGSNSTAVVVQLVQQAAKLGCDGALVVTPYYNKPTQSGLIAHYEKVADESPVPIFLYNVPGRTSVCLAVETTCRLLKHPRIAGIKEASGQYGNWLGLSTQMPLNEKVLFAGDDDAFAAVMSLGGHGTISASANVAPEAFVALLRAAQEKRWEDVFAIQKKLCPLIRSLFLESNPAPLKHALWLRRRLPAALRLPLVSVTTPTQAALESALRELEYLA